MLGKKGASARKLNNCRNSMEQLSVAEGKLGSVMTRLLGVDIFNKKLEMDEERWKPILPVQSISLETLGLSLRDLDTRPTSLRRSRRRRKMTLTAVPKRRRWQKNIITFPDLVDKQAQLTVPWQIPKNRAGKSANPDLSFYSGANERLPEEAVQPDPGREEQEQAWRQETLIEDVSDPFTCPWLVPVVKVVKYRKTVCPRAAWFRATVRVIVDHHRTIFLAFLSLSTDLCPSPVTLVKT